MKVSRKNVAVMAKTVCVECNHYLETSFGWWGHRCRHPDVRLQSVQDPVTGEFGYASKNDLGKAIVVDEKYPHCAEYNHGNCPMYERK